MKRFIFSILCVSTFFMGLGSLVSQVGARFKSDERALALIEQARAAVGGDANIKAVRSLSAKGRAVQTFNVDGTDKLHDGDFEINLALPNKFSKMTKLRLEDKGADGAKQTISENKQVFVFKKSDDKTISDSVDENTSPNKTFIIRKSDGANENAENIGTIEPNKIVNEMRVLRNPGEHQNNEFVRTMLSLFLTAPEGVDVAYFYIGSGDVDGNACEIVEAKTGAVSIAKIYLSKANNLPVMLSYQGNESPKMLRINRDEMKSNPKKKDVKVFVRELREQPSVAAEINVKFSDYRSVNGLLLPFAWTQTINGKVGETVSIESYEINPANIADEFNQAPERIRLIVQEPQ